MRTESIRRAMNHCWDAVDRCVIAAFPGRKVDIQPLRAEVFSYWKNLRDGLEKHQVEEHHLRAKIDEFVSTEGLDESESLILVSALMIGVLVSGEVIRRILWKGV